MTKWLDLDIFSIYLAHKIRRKTGDVNKELSAHIFADHHNLDETHILDVLECKAEPSDELLLAVDAEMQISQKKVYRFK